MASRPPGHAAPETGLERRLESPPRASVTFRVKRRLLNFLTSLSLVLLAAATLMWVRSAFTSDVWVHTRLVPPAQGWRLEQVADYVVSRDGGLLLRRSRGGGGFITTTQPTDEGWRHDSGFVSASVPQWTLPRVATWLAWPGVRAGRLHAGSYGGFGSIDETEIEFRYWLVVVLAAIFPVTQMPRLMHARRRRRRQRRGLCAVCGYDLRGGSERCPECGAERAS